MYTRTIYDTTLGKCTGKIVISQDNLPYYCPFLFQAAFLLLGSGILISFLSFAVENLLKLLKINIF